MHEIYNGIDIGKVKICEFKYYVEEVPKRHQEKNKEKETN